MDRAFRNVTCQTCGETVCNDRFACCKRLGARCREEKTTNAHCELNFVALALYYGADHRMSVLFAIRPWMSTRGGPVLRMINGFHLADPFAPPSGEQKGRPCYRSPRIPTTIEVDYFPILDFAAL